jgi:hypothetical protein
MTQRVFVGNQSLQDLMESLVSTILEVTRYDEGETNEISNAKTRFLQN